MRMELLFLISSIIYNTLLSFFLSLLLPFQYIYFHHLTPSNSNSNSDSDSDSDSKQEEEASSSSALLLYQGTVWHERRRPVRHSFKYQVRYALIDLDRGPNTLPSSFFSNHLSAHQARQITSTSGPVFLLTIPPSVGYEQNPLTLYYCYEFHGPDKYLKKCIAEDFSNQYFNNLACRVFVGSLCEQRDETINHMTFTRHWKDNLGEGGIWSWVTNTPWGERVSFVFNPESDSVAKPLHVSPFMDMLGNWKVRANTPGDDLQLAISVQHPKLGDYFTATLNAKRVPSGACNPALFFWLIPQKIALWIYWQAVKLWWKDVQFIQHPKYVSQNYRDEALMRDRMLQCCQTLEEDEKRNLKVDKSHSDGLNTDISEGRWCMWRDAQWPWN